ncbi:MAG: hypothetical protein WDN31_11310 [Hyphomicrobium sp.]
MLWETATDGSLVIAEVATDEIRDFGTPQGSFDITDTVTAT